MSISTVAVIGLGNMGGPMAVNLAKSGLSTRGFDVSDQARSIAEEAGVQTFDTAVEAAQGAEAVITMLPNGDLVKKVVGELVESDSTAKLYIDSSTISVQDAREVGELINEQGSLFLMLRYPGALRVLKLAHLHLWSAEPKRHLTRRNRCWTLWAVRLPIVGKAAMVKLLKLAIT